MKATCYLRVARGERGFVFGVTSRPSTAPLGDIVTRQFKLVLDLPESMFRSVDGLIEVSVPENALATITAEAEEPS